jgi:hypothetical protein
LRAAPMLWRSESVTRRALGGRSTSGMVEALSTTTIWAAMASLWMACRQRGSSWVCWSQTGMTIVRSAAMCSCDACLEADDVERDRRVGRMQLDLVGERCAVGVVGRARQRQQVAARCEVQLLGVLREV